MRRSSPLVLVALAAAVLGGSLALLGAKATGLLDGGDEHGLRAAGCPRARLRPQRAGLRERPSAGRQRLRPGADLRGALAGRRHRLRLLRQGRPARGSGLRVRRLRGRLHPDERARGHERGRSGRRRPRRAGCSSGSRTGTASRPRSSAGTSTTTSRSCASTPGAHALAPVPLGDSSRVRAGDPVAAMGSPFGNEDSIAVGVVSAVRRSIVSLTSHLQGRRRDPDRRADHARKLGRPALRRPRARDRDQRPDPHRQRHGRGRRLRDPDQRGASARCDSWPRSATSCTPTSA